jgi:hypothetical protein
MIVMLRILLLTISLTLTGLARAEILVVTSPELNLGNLSTEDVRQIFSGRKSAVNGQSVEPLDLPAENPVRSAFYQKVLDMNESQLRSHWVRMSFTGKGKPPEMLSGPDELKARLGSGDSNGIGYISSENLAGNLDVVYRVD